MSLLLGIIILCYIIAAVWSAVTRSWALFFIACGFALAALAQAYPKLR